LIFGIVPILAEEAAESCIRRQRKKTLYMVGRGSAYKIATQAVGFKGRAK
jgi:hypothetical protein